jgi:hypothetical protein
VREVPRSAITRIEVSRRPSRRGKGVGIGVLAGLGAAVAIGIATGDDCGSLPGPAEADDFVARLNRNLCMDNSATGLVAAILTVPVGAVIGMGAAGGEKWARTSPDRLRLAVKPTRTGGLGAAVSLRF